MEKRKPIEGLDGYYASDKGFIYRVDSEYPDEMIVIGSYPTNGETPHVYINGNRYSIANLVAKTFIPNDISGPSVVFHLDGDSSNNTIENLIWVTPSERSRLTNRNNIGNIRKVYIEHMRKNGLE